MDVKANSYTGFLNRMYPQENAENFRGVDNRIFRRYTAIREKLKPGDWQLLKLAFLNDKPGF
jgi:hypothetical protein